MGSDSVLASLQVVLGADISGYEAAMGKTWTVASAALDKLKGFGEDMSIYVTAPILAAAGAIVYWTAEQETADAQLSASLRNVGVNYNNVSDDVHQYIEGLQNLSGYKDLAIEDSFVQLTNVTGSAATSLQALLPIMDVAAGTGRDLSQVTLAVGRALEGNNTALQRMGIFMQKNMSTTQILDALLAKFGGDAAMVAQTIQGKWNLINAQFQDVAKTIGSALTPVIKSVEDVILDLIGYLQTMATWFANQSPAIQNTIVAIVALVAAAGPAIVAFATLATGLIAVATALTLGGGLTAILATMTGVLGAVASAAVAVVVPFLVLVATFALFYAGSVAFMANLDKMDSGLEAIFYDMTQVVADWASSFLKDLASIVQSIPGFGAQWATALDTAADNAKKFGDEAGVAFKASSDAYTSAGDYMTNTTTALKGQFTDLASIVGVNLNSVNKDVDNTKTHIGGLGDGLDQNVKKWKDWAAQIKPTVQSLATSVIGDFATLASDMATSIGQGTFNASALLTNFLVSMIGQIVQFQILSMTGFQTLSEAIAVSFSNPYVAAVAIAGMIALVAGLNGQFSNGVHLANGGMSTGITQAVIGDNPSGKEVVLPLDSPQTTEALSKAMPQGGAGDSTQYIYVQIGDEVVAQAAVRGMPSILRLVGATSGT